MTKIQTVIGGLILITALDHVALANGIPLDNGQVTSIEISKAVDIDQALFFKNNLYLAVESNATNLESDTVSRIVRVRKNNGRFKTLVNNIPGRISKMIRLATNSLLVSSKLSLDTKSSAQLLELDFANGDILKLADFDAIQDFGKNREGYYLIENRPEDNEEAAQEAAILRAGRIDGRQMVLQLDFNGATISALDFNDDYDHIYSIFNLRGKFFYEKSFLQLACDAEKTEKLKNICLEEKLSHQISSFERNDEEEIRTSTVFEGHFMNSSLEDANSSVLLDPKVVKKKLYFLFQQEGLLNPLVDLYRISANSKVSKLIEDLDANTEDFHLNSNWLYTITNYSNQTVLKEIDLSNGNSSLDVLSLANDFETNTKPLELVSSQGNRLVLLKFSAKELVWGHSINEELKLLIYDFAEAQGAAIEDQDQ